MRLPILRSFLALVGLALLATAAEAQGKRRSDMNKITRAEIDEGGTIMGTARDAIRLLRPQWFRPPTGRFATGDVGSVGANPGETIVYIDDVRQPDLESLTLVPLARIFEMKYLDQNRAVQMRGAGHEGGVIEVITVDRRK